VAERFDMILKNGTVATPSGMAQTDVGIVGESIARIGALGGADAPQILDLAGLTILPGMIDTQVHFREPGMEHKEDIATGTAAAALGGITGICEMPNTKPPTTTAALLNDKLARAKGRAFVDHAFFVGASPDTIDTLAALEQMPGCSGIKMFMGSSTGTLLVAEDDAIARVLAQGYRRVAVHSEDEARLKERWKLVEGGAPVSMHPVWRDAEAAFMATTRLMRLARKAGRRVHVLHTTTAQEIALLAENKDIATVEVTPQHLTLVAPDCYERLGTYAQMNPPIRDDSHRQALWKGIADGTVDVLGSDHAPHTRAEKDATYPNTPSGMPGVQTMIPIMLDHVAAGRLSLERLIDLLSTGPARIYSMVGKGRIDIGYDADFTIVDLKARRTIKNSWIASRCGWTPYDGMKVTGWPMLTIQRGQIIMREDQLLGEPAGRPIRFAETEPKSQS
jgi:dihydroorotase